MLSPATISVITNDGRNIVVRLCLIAPPFSQVLAARRAQTLAAQGILRGYDQATNLILDECHERVFSSKVMAVLCTCLALVCLLSNKSLKLRLNVQSGVDQVVLGGLHVVRGDNMCALQYFWSYLHLRASRT